MAWVRFTRNFDFKPTTQTTIAYKAGTIRNVTATCAERAVRKGAAVRMKKAAKSEAPVEDNGKAD